MFQPDLWQRHRLLKTPVHQYSIRIRAFLPDEKQTQSRKKQKPAARQVMLLQKPPQVLSQTLRRDPQRFQTLQRFQKPFRALWTLYAVPPVFAWSFYLYPAV